jgi:hypothetical protein
MGGERGDPVTGCRRPVPSEEQGWLVPETETEGGRRRLRARDFEVSGKPEGLSSWVFFGLTGSSKGCWV